MSKGKSVKKKKGKASDKENKIVSKKKLEPTVSRKKMAPTLAKGELIFERQNYILMAAGFGLVLLGMLMMMGGSMPSPDVWDESIIYSTRITVIAPILILAGLILEIYAIFKD